MKLFKKQALVLAVTGTLMALPAFAAEPDRTPEHIGLGSGAAVGALVGGPLGAIVGSFFGVMIGHEQVQKSELAANQASIAQMQTKLEQRRDDLDAVNESLHSKRQALRQAQQRLRDLSGEYAALQGLVSGLRLAVYFDHNSSALSPEYQALLRSVGQGAGGVTGLVIDLDAHASKAGPDQYNQQLSAQRNEAVGGELLAQGVAETHLRKQAQGSQQANSERIYAPEDRRVDLLFRFERPQGLVSLD